MLGGPQELVSTVGVGSSDCLNVKPELSAKEVLLLSQISVLTFVPHPC
jgi:hypothetical protein